MRHHKNISMPKFKRAEIPGGGGLSYSGATDWTPCLSGPHCLGGIQTSRLWVHEREHVLRKGVMALCYSAVPVVFQRAGGHFKRIVKCR